MSCCITPWSNILTIIIDGNTRKEQFRSKIVSPFFGRAYLSDPLGSFIDGSMENSQSNIQDL